MSAAAIGGASTTTSEAHGFGALDSNEFLQIIIKELSNQDPLQPQDTQALLEQLSTIRDIESQVSLQEDLESLVLQNSVTSASALIGKQVKGLDASNRNVAGTVTAMRIESDKPILVLDSGNELPADNVTEVVNSQNNEKDDAALMQQLSLLDPAALIGKQVSGKDVDDDVIEGIVTAIRIENDKAILELDSGKSLPVDRLSRYSDAPAGLLGS